MPRFVRHIAFALPVLLIASLQPATAQSLSAAQLQVYYERCLVTVLTYEAEIKDLNNRISFVDNSRQIAGLGSLPWNNPNEAMRKQADELYGRLSIDLADLRERVKWLLTYRRIEKISCAFYKKLMLEAREREKGGGPIAGGGNQPSVIEHEQKEKEFKRKLDEAKDKIGHVEKDLAELERIRAMARSLQPIPPPPPKKSAGGSWDFGVFGGGVFGGNSPELKPFDQNLDQDGGYQIGTDMIWRNDPANGFVVWSIGLESSYTQRDAAQITNQFAPGVLPVRGHDSTFAGLVVGGLEIPLGPVRLRADAGAGVGIRDVELHGLGGAPIASGDGTVFAWRAGGGVIVPLGQETFLQLMYIHQNFGAVDAATSGGTPFEFDYQTPRVYRFTVGFRY